MIDWCGQWGVTELQGSPPPSNEEMQIGPNGVKNTPNAALIWKEEKDKEGWTG